MRNTVDKTSIGDRKILSMLKEKYNLTHAELLSACAHVVAHIVADNSLRGEDSLEVECIHAYRISKVSDAEIFRIAENAESAIFEARALLRDPSLHSEKE